MDTVDSIMPPLFLSGLQANKDRLGYVGRKPGAIARDSDEWYTPTCFIERARLVMGSIDLDPFSSAEANATIKAGYYFDPHHSALTHAWRSPMQKRRYPDGVNVWMNPPYGMPLILQAIEALLHACRGGHVAQAIVLVNNATETRWFHRLCATSAALCFPSQRIAFHAPDGKAIGGNTRGQVFFYLAASRNATAQFCDHFGHIGFTMVLKEGECPRCTTTNP